MIKRTPLSRDVAILSFVAGVSVTQLGRLTAQPAAWSPTPLDRIRAEAGQTKGPLPVDVHVLRFGRFTAPESLMVDGGSGQSVSGVYTVFQVRFPTGWIMIDAGMDPEIAGDTTEAYRRADEQVRRALEGASTIVVTHEHHDHVGGVVRSPSLERLLPRTRLTTEQIRTLMERPNVPLIRLDSAAAARYRPLDYDRTYPLAPGVVLIKAPGHTPGSQMVYLRLASGKELLLIGDVAWAMAGVERRRLPPPAAIKEYGMNPNQIALQLDWLHSLLVDRPEIAVTNAHDDGRLEKLIRQGVLVEGLIGATQ